ncbi:unnamed protein product [Moneuplotes crassus]|uniref:Uncharacterized protein n=1 Tax=Euplotes crassus TaxID=5936 RepID=A0AAD1Y0L4_EUPCR|nr:unnamed protein product [Moneuplotes crassus]
MPNHEQIMIIHAIIRMALFSSHLSHLSHPSPPPPVAPPTTAGCAKFVCKSDWELYSPSKDTPCSLTLTFFNFLSSLFILVLVVVLLFNEALNFMPFFAFNAYSEKLPVSICRNVGKSPSNSCDFLSTSSTWAIIEGITISSRQSRRGNIFIKTIFV